MKNLLIKFILLGLVGINLQGCGSLNPRSASSKELANILIPVKDSLVSSEKKPLIFPTTIAILMVPGNYNGMIPDSTLRLAAEELKKELLKNDKYINGISIISSGDIREKISLSTIRNLYGADIVVVISYQQDQRRTQNSLASFMNIAIAPAFLIPSVKVTTSTIIDGKIIHIPSNAIIFRSSGTDERSTYLTPVSSNQGKANDESISGFVSSLNKFGENVGIKLAQLDKFDMSNAVSMNKVINEQSNLQGKPGASGDSWAKVDSYKSSGGGAFDEIGIFILCLMAIYKVRKEKF